MCSGKGVVTCVRGWRGSRRGRRVLAVVRPGPADFAAYTFGYHDTLPRIETIDHEGRLFRPYGATGLASGGYTSEFEYDSQDRLLEAKSIVHGTTEHLRDRYFKTTLDNAGNRKTMQSIQPTGTNYQTTYRAASSGGLGSGPTGANSADQYGHIQGQTSVVISGTAPNVGQYGVRVNGQTVGRPNDGDFFYLDHTEGGGGQNHHGTATIEWFHQDTPADVITASQDFFIPAKERPQAYDLNGNLTSDGVFTYTWDTADRLVTIESISASPVKFRKEFRYDYLSRRVEERFLTWVGIGWLPEYTRRYLYDGWTVVAEFRVPTVSTVSLEKTLSGATRPPPAASARSSSLPTTTPDAATTPATMAAGASPSSSTPRPARKSRAWSMTSGAASCGPRGSGASRPSSSTRSGASTTAHGTSSRTGPPASTTTASASTSPPPVASSTAIRSASKAA